MQVLRVFPNPFAATDKDGVPCAVCPRDPDADGGGPASFVGARVSRSGTQVLQDFSKQGRVGTLNIGDYELRSPIQRTRYEYLGIQSTDPELARKLSEKAPIELPATKYYKDRLREGALLPADAETAHVAKLAGFVDPKVVFARYAPAPELPATPGLDLLPQSPDAQGNVLEAPALPDGASRGAIDLPADGEFRSLDLDAPLGGRSEAAPADTSAKSTKPKKPNQESAK
jgi:hypothetical protein